MKKNRNIKTVIPISADDYWSYDTNKKAEQIILLHKQYGFETFMLSIPSHVGSNYKYPERKDWEAYAEKFSEIKNKLKPYKLTCGWWIGETITSGLSNEMQHMINKNGVVNLHKSVKNGH